MTTRTGLDNGGSQRWQRRPKLCPATRCADDRELPAERVDAVLQAAQPGARDRPGFEARAVVADFDQEPVPLGAQAYDHSPRRGVLHGVCQSLADGEVGGALDRLREAGAPQLAVSLEADGVRQPRNPVLDR